MRGKTQRQPEETEEGHTAEDRFKTEDRYLGQRLRIQKGKVQGV